VISRYVISCTELYICAIVVE